LSRLEDPANVLGSKSKSFMRTDGMSLSWHRVEWMVVLLFTVGSFNRSVIAQEILYNRDIRPILSEHCFACHGPDSASRQADLRLDQRDAAIASSAVVPGNVESSGVVARIFSTDPETVMPPPESKKELTEAQKKTLQDWIAAGAPYQPHWSFLPPSLPNLPEVRNAAWVRQPLDRFVLERLESMGLEPAPPADLRTLIRRVCLDLTGLPPTAEEISEVLNDPSEDRYERYVDRLMDRESWGEHRGRYWLDYARYADTHGIHFDNFREMWSYRDWVIDAFNRNLPFDQFTVEQLAGDLLPNPTLDQKIATGFHRCNITTNEGGIIDEEYRVLYARDRTETTSLVWMGLTAGCAVCHDHKFDPLSMREFYSMSAFFNNTTQGPRDGNIKDTPPKIAVPLREDRARYEALPQEIEKSKAAVADRRTQAVADFQNWLASNPVVIPATPATQWELPLTEGSAGPLLVLHSGQLQRIPLGFTPDWKPGHVAALAWNTNGQQAPALGEFGNIDRTKPFTLSAWIRRPNQGMVGAVLAKMDDPDSYRGWDLWLENDRIGMHLVHRWPDNAIKFVSAQTFPPDRWTHVTITYDGSSKASGCQVFFDGKPVGINASKDSLSDTMESAVPLRLGRRNRESAVTNVQVQSVRFSDQLWSSEQIAISSSSERLAYLLSKATDARSAEETEEVFVHYLNTQDAVYRELSGQLAQREADKLSIENRGTVAHVMQERAEPAIAYVLNRGEYDQRRDEVKPSTPQILPPFSEDLPLNRLGLARWLVRDEHPLTARVTVNRFWQEIFGRGLVATAGDFGVTGELPSHPELLDYLAVTFRNEKWDVKKFFRSLVTSATYRQSSQLTPEKFQADPDNRWLSRGPRFRMDAEMIRDYALACSGVLSKKIGGPSVRPYQPPGVWEAVAMPESNTRNYREDEGENLYRRSMYTFWKRSAPPASMDIFNAPNREQCTVRRERTNTPIQALVTLNDPQFIEAARRMAQRMLLDSQIPPADPLGRIQWLSERILARPMLPAELEIAQQNVTDLLAYYQAHPEAVDALLAVGRSAIDGKVDRSELAGWTMLVNELLNLDETLNK
jgi:hypothetical protein